MSDLFKNLFGAVAGPVFLLGGFYIMYRVMELSGVDIESAVSITLALSPIWLPITLFFVLFEQWMEYVHLKFYVYNGRTTLRIHLPQNVFKSPAAMENVMAQIHNANSPDNLMQTYIDGKHPLTYSFELVSIGGEVRFYINVPTKKVKNMVEAQLYAEYPGIEVTEEPMDYTDEIFWNPEKYDMIAFHMGKKADEVFPVKTYIDMGLDKMPKEEEKSDPMAGMLEQLGKTKPHERVWIQILAVPHTAKTFKTGHLFEKPTWEGKVAAKVNEIMKRDVRVDPSNEDQADRQVMLTSNERDKITAMERNAGKYAYEVGIRWIYITETGKFDGDIISPILRSFANYDILNRNGIGARWRTDFDYNALSDFTGRKRLRWKRSELLYYKLRKYYMRERRSRVDEAKVMSVEELATMFHIPGASVATPTLPRITSTKKEAPSNLPTGMPTGI